MRSFVLISVLATFTSAIAIAKPVDRATPVDNIGLRFDDISPGRNMIGNSILENGLFAARECTERDLTEIDVIGRYLEWFHRVVSAVNNELAGGTGSVTYGDGYETHSRPWTFVGRPETLEEPPSEPDTDEPTTCLELQQLRQEYDTVKSREKMYYIL